MVPLLGLWCPRPQAGEGHDPCDPLGSAPGAEKVLAGLGMVSRTGQGSVRKAVLRSTGPGWVGHGRL